MSLVSIGQIFSLDECTRLTRGINGSTSEEIVVKLDKTSDDVWFDVVYQFIKKHNSMKLAISSISEMSIIKPESSASRLNHIFNWSSSNPETKLNFFINLSSPDDFLLLADSGSENQMRSLDGGACCVWPSFATSDLCVQTKDVCFAVYGTVIGKKLS